MNQEYQIGRGLPIENKEIDASSTMFYDAAMNIFTNIDHRLRPIQNNCLKISRDKPCEIGISTNEFPDLHKDFSEMQRRIGIAGYDLVILGDGWRGAGTDFHRKLIGVGISMINGMSYAEILSVVAHELGHAARYMHPDREYLGQPVLGLDRGGSEEVEADRLGACLRGEDRTAIQALRDHNVEMKGAPPIDSRIEALKTFHLKQCNNWIIR